MDIFANREISDQSALDTIKTIINEWSNKVPHHSHKNFGDQITIEKVELKPAYQVELCTQYDQRLIEVKVVPYRGEELAKQLYTYPDEVDRWKYECEEPEDFINTSNIYHVHGSDRVEQCYNCGGHGKLRCHTCDTRGYITCTTCGGKKSWRCGTCGGRGHEYRTCGHCGGTGQYLNQSTNSYQSCSYCRGSKQIKHECYVCNGTGIKHCSKCRGSGVIDCPTCGTKGYITCTKCEGQGKLNRYYEIHQKLHFTEAISVHKHPDFDEYYSYFSVDWESDNSELILDISDRYYEIDEFSLPDFLQTLLQELLKKARTHISEHEDFHRQQVRIRKYDVFEVEYEWQGESNTLLVDATNGLVYDPHGPIYAKIIALNDEAEELYDSKKYNKAIKINNQALEMDLGNYLGYVSDLQEKLADKMMGTYRIGIWLVNLPMMALVYYFFMHFFTRPWFYLDEFNELFTRFELFPVIFAHHMAVIFVLRSLFVLPEQIEESLKGRFGKYITNSPMRLLIGLTGTLALSLYNAVLMIVINWSGLSLISGFAVFGLYKAVMWIIHLF